MPDYADTSFLVSSYLQDANTSSAKSYLAQVGSAFAFTRFHQLEISNAFQLALFRKWIDAQIVANAKQEIRDDLRKGRLLRTGVRYSQIFRRATDLSEKYAAITGVRNLDLLHVASAQMLNATTFATFDGRQRDLAKLVGLRVVP